MPPDSPTGRRYKLRIPSAADEQRRPPLPAAIPTSLRACLSIQAAQAGGLAQQRPDLCSPHESRGSVGDIRVASDQRYWHSTSKLASGKAAPLIPTPSGFQEIGPAASRDHRKPTASSVLERTAAGRRPVPRPSRQPPGG